jgi:hypothetical protein
MELIHLLLHYRFIVLYYLDHLLLDFGGEGLRHLHGQTLLLALALSVLGGWI